VVWAHKLKVFVQSADFYELIRVLSFTLALSLFVLSCFRKTCSLCQGFECMYRNISSFEIMRRWIFPSMYSDFWGLLGLWLFYARKFFICAVHATYCLRSGFWINYPSKTESRCIAKASRWCWVSKIRSVLGQNSEQRQTCCESEAPSRSDKRTTKKRFAFKNLSTQSAYASVLLSWIVRRKNLPRPTWKSCSVAWTDCVRNLNLPRH